MQTTLLIVFGFIILMTLILNHVKKDRIEPIGNFFVKVLPRIPFTSIVKILKRKDDDIE